MKRTLIIATLALATAARASAPDLSQVLSGLRAEFPALVVKAMPAADVRTLCEYVANYTRTTESMRVVFAMSKAQRLASIDNDLVNGVVDARMTRIHYAITEYVYAQEPAAKGDALARTTLLTCRLQLEP